MTANTIQGAAPYLTYDGGITKVTNTDELLGIRLSNGTIYTQLSNPSSASSPIELPVADQTFSDIKTLIPSGLTTISLSFLIDTPYNNWGDDDGDGLGAGGVSATGSLSVSIIDVNGNSVSLTETLSGCNAPYSLTLTSTAGTLNTQYGVPNSTLFNSSSTTYYITPKIISAYTCFSEPNLNYSSSNNPWGYSDMSGPESQWDDSNGFKLQDVLTPGSNFPTMGFNNAYFNLTIAGALGSDVTYNKSPITSGLDLTLTGIGNLAKVVLTGPKYGDSATKAATAQPTTFTLYSDAGKTHAICSFTIGKWFIAKPGGAGGYPAAQTYCSGLGYRVPGVAQYTNGNGNDWTGGLSGQSNNYQRRIGGGLFAEWGYTHSGYYTGSDFDGGIYWASESYGSGSQRIVNSGGGGIGNWISTITSYKAACVSP